MRPKFEIPQRDGKYISMQPPGYLNNTDCVVSAPGRIRIKCPKLYRSHAEKTKIEARLSSCKNITAVYANPLTARVLVLFDARIPLDEIISSLGLPVNHQAVAGTGNGAHQIKVRAARTPGPPRQAEAEARPRRQIYPAWHLQSADAALEFHGSSRESGLRSAVAAERLKQSLNLLPQPPARSSFQIMIDQFKSLPVLLLGISAGLSVLTGGFPEALAIVSVLALNSGIGFVTERRAEAAIASLSELIDDLVPVVRDGKLNHVATSHVAAGDILLLVPGIRVAADARLVQTSGLTIDESALTGESMPVAKSSAALSRPVPLADRVNMAYRGTAVSMGTGLALVVGTGGNTEIGAIQELMVHTEHPRTPLQKQLDQLGNQLVKASSTICGGVFVIGLMRGYGLLQMLKVSISLAIAAVPEGLPAVATTSLARGIRLMRERDVLIRRLQAVETIGAIQTICLDKTGTLTMNRMSAVEIRAGMRNADIGNGMDPDLARLLQVCVLCNEAEFSEKERDTATNGSSTELALLDLAVKGGVAVIALRRQYPLLDTELRAEGRNYMTTVHAMPDSQRHLVAIKGSPAEVLDLCQYYQSDGQIIALQDDIRADILRQNEEMAGRRLRVLGFAFTEVPQEETRRADTPNAVWIGLVGLADPLRPGVKDLIAGFQNAGIRTVMVTGDQSTTAYAIGSELGLGNGDQLRILSAEQMEQMNPETLRSLGEAINIFARVSPSHKLQIVQSLQGRSKIIAMTGDGINDGPALQAADVGIAMGNAGTDLARSAADIILMEDNLETLLEAIRQGRSISDNIRKSLHFLLSSNLSEIIVVLGGITSGAGSPLNPMQLLWLNLLTDVLPAIALAAEPPETDVMKLQPRDPVKPIVGIAELKRYAREAAVISGGALGAYVFGMMRYGPGGRAGAIAFNTLILGQLMHAYSCRSDRYGIFSRSPALRNRQLDLAVGASVGLQVLANLMPPLRTLLGIGPTGVADIAVTLAGAGLPLLLNEAAKKAPSEASAKNPTAGIN
ncbi:MAG: cation-transporting P-type ATPase [Burkholderia sp.]|nr:cation-transporting P-type ATPase [Burkholderia sp.]